MNAADPRLDALAPGMTRPAVDLFTEPAFLEIVARIYHPGRHCTVRDYEVAGQVFRLLDVEGDGPAVRQTFIDVHRPLEPAPPGAPLPHLARLPDVAGEPMTVARFHALCDEAQRRGEPPPFGAPTLLWRTVGTWEDYLAMLRERRVLAEDVRRARRLQERVGTLRFRADDTAPDVLPTAFAWKSARDRSLDRADLFATDAHRHFFHALRLRGLLRASTLRAEDRLLAIWLGALHRGHWNGWIFTFNPDRDLARFSPGRQLLYPMLESSCRAGHGEFDFSIGTEPYKLQFATHVRLVGLAGAPPVGERLQSAAARWLRQHPWMHAQARALRRRFAEPGGRALAASAASTPVPAAAPAPDR